MILRGQESGTFDPSHDKIVEYSSGNTVISLAILNGLYGAQQGATAYISNKTSQQKLQLLRFFVSDICVARIGDLTLSTD